MDERLKTILSAIEKLPADTEILLPASGGKFTYTNIPTNDLHYLRTCLVEREELLGEADQIRGLKDAIEIRWSLEYFKGLGWFAYDGRRVLVSEKQESPIAAFKALKETK